MSKQDLRPTPGMLEAARVLYTELEEQRRQIDCAVRNERVQPARLRNKQRMRLAEELLETLIDLQERLVAQYGEQAKGPYLSESQGQP